MKQKTTKTPDGFIRVPKDIIHLLKLKALRAKITLKELITRFANE